ncbi:RNA polymerase sigma-70 factor [Dyadobacter sp. CY323]|uniref:RNA polymerase sigma-70 factor n=1 Tax=Dyadobacter sp. CY323 TaxID=2907302 RepID=UPI001F482A3C|nr:RNA polymerase sigma-70 factor [Dyadobacter sp. CY323]
MLERLQRKASDESAFEAIYDRYWNKLLAIAYNHLRDKQASEEVVQEIFITLWERRSKVEIESLPAYLATAVKFAVFKAIATEKRHQDLISSNYTQETVQWDEPQIHARFLEEYLNTVTESLPEKCRLVFIYSRQQGLVIPDIAREMNISPKTVEAHLSKALKILRLSLKDIQLLMMVALLKEF